MIGPRSKQRRLRTADTAVAPEHLPWRSFHSRTAATIAGTALLLVAAEPASVKKLDPASRASALMALTGLVVLGCGMVFLVMLGGRMARRLARARVASRGGQRRIKGGTWLPGDPPAGADSFDAPEEEGR